MLSEQYWAYDTIITKYGEASREGQLAWAAMTQAQIDATRHASGKINDETQRAVDAIKSKYGDLKNDKNANLTNWRELASKQVSTLVTDFGKGFADIVFSAGSFGSKLIGLFSQIGQTITRGWIESGFAGLLSGQGLSGFSGFGKGLLDAFKGQGGGAAKTGFNLAGVAPNVAKLFGLGTATAGTTAASGLIAGAAFAPSVGGSLASIASAGAVPGFLLAGSTVPGLATAGTAAATTGTGLAATMGAFATNPITIAATAGIAGVLLTRQLTRRGREKEDATTQAEDLSSDVWQGIVPEVQQGRATVDAGIAAIQQRFADYEDWLHANLKDQTVITRSIESQRITMTEGIAALEKLRSNEAAMADVRSKLEAAIQDFGETGAISQEFSDLIVKLGGNLEEFKTLIADTSNLESMQAGFAGLSAAIHKTDEPLKSMYEKFLESGEITDEFAAAIEKAGGSLEEFQQFALATDNLNDFNAGIGTMIEGLEKLAPSAKSAYDTFFELGQITPELADEIERFGLNIEDFENLSGIMKVKNDFASLRAEILTTGGVRQNSKQSLSLSVQTLQSWEALSSSVHSVSSKASGKHCWTNWVR